MTEKMMKLRDTFTASYLEGLADDSEKRELSNDEGFKKIIEELALLISNRKPAERKRLQTIVYVNHFFLRTVYLDDGSIVKSSHVSHDPERPMISEAQVEIMVEDGEITWAEAEKEYEIVNVNNYMHHGRNEKGGF